MLDWWAAEDATKFEAQATRLGSQCEAFTFPNLPGLHITPKLTMGATATGEGGRFRDHGRNRRTPSFVSPA